MHQWETSTNAVQTPVLAFLAIPTKLLLWVYDICALCMSLLNKLVLFLHRGIQRMILINMNEVKEQGITNETVRKIFLDITNIRQNIATG